MTVIYKYIPVTVTVYPMWGIPDSDSDGLGLGCTGPGSHCARAASGTGRYRTRTWRCHGPAHDT